MNASKAWTIMAALLLTAAVGCGRRSVPPPPSSPSDPGAVPGRAESGIASWYGPGFHGKRTANGEVYDMNAQTAAHKTLPFGTWVRVRNLDNNKSTLVRINDRGPFIAGRIIDLSKKAARDIDLVVAGVARVRLTIAQPPRSGGGGSNGSNPGGGSQSGIYLVQVGAFRDRNRAQELKRQLGGRYGKVEIESANVNGQLYHRVQVGRLNSIQQARNLADRIHREQRLQNRPFVLRRQ
ncbi:MAG: septal ring lytic transglycosylase RlpA family protein [Acidobacteriota bacterium]